MAERPTVALPFGGGVDRYSGTTIAEPSAFRDLRNVHLRRGGAERRGGLGLAADLDDDALIGIFPVRSQGIGALITYVEATQTVRLYLTSADGSEVIYVADLWTLDVDAALPRVLAGDLNDVLVIAHDEPIYAKRQVTRVYDPAAGTIVNLTADLYLPTDPITPVDVKFRGVMTYLNYLVGWGYGSENVGDDNRPEVVRVSKPGEIVFLPEHYFIAGSRGDPVLSCAPAGDVLMVRKPSSSARIVGYDRASFGIVPADRHYGIAASRLSVTIGGVNYFWSLDGPRRSDGGLSEDLGLPLDLGGPSPDSLAASASLDYGFAVYRPDHREIEFVFGRWAYVYHLGEQGAERWSFREYGVELISGGILYEFSGGGSGGSSIGTPAYAEFDSAAAGAPAGGVSLLTVDYTTVNALIGGEIAELWARSHFAGDTWVKIGEAAATSPAGVVTGNVARMGTTFDVAVRLTYLGIPGGGYVSSNPSDWPATARGTVQTAVPAPTIANPVWSRASAAAHGFTFDRTGGTPVAGHAELTSILEHRIGAGAWVPHAAQPISANPTALDLTNPEAGYTVEFRMKDVSAEGVESPYSASEFGWSGLVSPAAPILTDPGILAGMYQLNWTWPAEADASWAFEILLHSFGGGGGFGVTHTQGHPTVQEFPTAPCGGASVEAVTRYQRTQYGVTDYSPYVNSNVIPGNC